ncbi:pyridoxamine 5'-phosphate oxidase family protein [Geobacter sp. DSM 9736]|uniref:pyridoxamine 5'-phosphate oxidase family protein n=1 Tax=Geobacter sp. DSM 9736 TaxID=1277350 RepID=UPI000B50724D|nr:pyridoxamine 5'-phosphate oxidase family protein [Geobacter sp. DSM 9736]SNB46768.1 Pyridoxamine 5'-phosphate oxidase [Geobacter sp. DSM 9736]
MKLAELFPEGGKGVIATADGDGSVNTAIYARPHLVDDDTLAWGMTDSRSYANLSANPRASYLYLAPGNGYSGWRLSLELKEIRHDGELLKEIKENTARIVDPTAGAAVKHVGYFRVIEVRPLV